MSAPNRRMRRLICLVLSHAHQSTQQDGKGAAWTTCDRCGKVTATHSFHGGRPWENA